LIEVYNHKLHRETPPPIMGKHKEDDHCPHPGCDYSGRSDNVKRHFPSHARNTLKYSPIIEKAKSERLNLKMPRLH
jgi:hypothetical protein